MLVIYHTKILQVGNLSSRHDTRTRTRSLEAPGSSKYGDLVVVVFQSVKIKETT